jgi:hypothetical protein
VTPTPTNPLLAARRNDSDRRRRRVIDALDRLRTNGDEITVSAVARTAGKAQGIIRDSLPSHEVAATMTWMVERACQQVLRYETSDTDDRLANSLAQIIWGALYLEPAPSS